MFDLELVGLCQAAVLGDNCGYAIRDRLLELGKDEVVKEHNFCLEQGRKTLKSCDIIAAVLDLDVDKVDKDFIIALQAELLK